MEYRYVGELEEILEGDGWYRAQGFRYKRNVKGVTGLKSAFIIYLIDFLCLYPESEFGVGGLNSVLAQLSSLNDQLSLYFSQLVGWISDMLRQNNLDLIQNYLNTPQTQSDFASFISSLSDQSPRTDLDLDLLKFISASLNLSIFLYHSPTSSKLQYKALNPILSLFIQVLSPDNYSILYPSDHSSFLFLVSKDFDSAPEHKNPSPSPSALPTKKLLDRTCQLCFSSYKSFNFPCSCIICHVCIEDHFFLKSYFNCPKCKSKQSVQERTLTLHFLKSLQRTLKPNNP